MAIQTRTIKRRIKSVKNTRKITKAMELVAASKMRKAVNSVLASRPFAKLAWETVQSIGRVTDTSLHPLLKESRDVQRVLIVLVTSDKGLAGGYNTNMIRKIMEQIRSLQKEIGIEIVCIGKRGADVMKHKRISILANFTNITNETKFEEVLPISRLLLDEYLQGRVQKILIAHTDFVSAVTQRANVFQLLPLARQSLDDGGLVHENLSNPMPISEYQFEPSPFAVLDRLLMRIVETTLYQSVLEAAASEHSARMIAMKSASDNAETMMDDLTFTFNQARQAGITQEIAEISSGKAALET